jgi:hypothetical protein
MNDLSQQSQSEFVLRRLSESFRIGGQDVSPLVWIGILIPVLILGLVYVVWMYRRDSRTIAWPWAVGLGTLRAVIYLILAGIFLLPAMQTWERSEKHGRVLLLLDVSPSVSTVSDEFPEDGSAPDKPATRLDRLISFLTDPQIDFVGRLMKQNPVSAFRFGARLDEDAAQFEKNASAWDAAHWRSWLRNDMKAWLLAGLSDDGQKRLQSTTAWEGDKAGTTEWAVAWLKLPAAEAVPPDLSEADAKLVGDRRGKLEKRLEAIRQVQLGTNVGESLRTLLNREANGMIQGVILVSDGRSNQGSESAVAELRARARKESIPIFAIQLGEDRQPVAIRITDVQTPEQTPPDEKFVVRVEIDGEGLPDQETKVFLDLFKPDEEKPAHTLETTIKFQPGEPPHAQAEFTLDPEQLPGDLKNEATGGKELIEGEWRFVVRIPREKRELFVDKEHRTDPASVQIIKKPLRILLVSGGPMKDYQFVRTLLVREKDAKRAELSVFLQNEGRDGRAVQDVEPERFLNRFPTTLRVEDDPNEKLEDKYYNLAQYDLIVCFDPDWSEFTQEQLSLLQKWVDMQAGGLLLIAGPVNTYQLARDDGSGRLKPLLDLFPVVPGDSVLQTGPVRRTTKLPWRLNFPGANPDMEFLKLDDNSKDLLSGWQEFFDGAEKKVEGQPRRGFFSFYPLKSVKPGATVIATFTDPAAVLEGKEQPFLVTQQFGKGRVVFVGSSEIWRLRQYKEVWYERFWMKLGRYASAGSRTRQHRRGVLVMGRQFSAGQYVRFEAQLFGPSLEPLPKSTKPKATILAAEGGERRDIEMTAKPSQSDWAGWFQGRMLLPKPGEYKLELPIPSSSDILRGKFAVRESNPELDNTRPDPAALAAMVGDLDDVLGRLKDKSALDELRQRLRGSRSTGTEAKPESPKLLFTLANAEAIPNCLPAVPPQVSRNRGPVDDLWDHGPQFGESSDGKPIVIATLLMVIVALLSIEWLTRKLLRLA